MKLNSYSQFNQLCNKRITYILATKNRWQFFEQALLRISKFIKPNDELIVIDGDSSDNTYKIARNYAHLINLFLSEQDLNPVHAVNKGFLLARGRYIIQIPDDDIIHPEAIEKVIRIMDSHPEIDLLICGGKISKPDDSGLKIAYVPKQVKFSSKIENLFKFSVTRGAGFIYRTASLAKTGLLPLDSVADLSFAVQCMVNNCIVRFCRINFYHAYNYDHSVMNIKRNQVEKDIDRLISKYASLSFYFRYRLNKTINQHKYINQFITKVLKFRKIFPKYSAYKNKVKISWDGSLS